MLSAFVASICHQRHSLLPSIAVTLSCHDYQLQLLSAVITGIHRSVINCHRRLLSPSFTVTVSFCDFQVQSLSAVIAGIRCRRHSLSASFAVAVSCRDCQLQSLSTGIRRRYHLPSLSFAFTSSSLTIVLILTRHHSLTPFPCCHRFRHCLGDILKIRSRLSIRPHYKP